MILPSIWLKEGLMGKKQVFSNIRNTVDLMHLTSQIEDAITSNKFEGDKQLKLIDLLIQSIDLYKVYSHELIQITIKSFKRETERMVNLHIKKLNKKHKLSYKEISKRRKRVTRKLQPMVEKTIEDLKNNSSILDECVIEAKRYYSK